MIKQYNLNTVGINNDITMFAEFGFDPHITISKEPSFDRSVYPLFTPCPLVVPSFLFEYNDYVTFRVTSRNCTNYVVDYANGAIKFSTKIKGDLYNLVLPVEYIVNTSNGDGTPYFKMDYAIRHANLLTILNPAVELAGTDPAINALVGVAEKTAAVPPVRKKNPFRLVGKEE